LNTLDFTLILLQFKDVVMNMIVVANRFNQLWSTTT